MSGNLEPQEEKTWRVLDLYCCAGGGAKGYELAGFKEIVGIDDTTKKEYPYFFIKADIEDFIYEQPREWFESFDLIHASPPCQGHSRLKHMCEAQGNIPCDKNYHLRMIRQFLKSLNNVEYVIENVQGGFLCKSCTMLASQGKKPAKKCKPCKEHRSKIPFLCGSHFGLAVERHRYFEASFPIQQLECDHMTSAWPIGPKGIPKPLGVYGSKGDNLKGMCKRTGKMQTGGWTAKDVPEAQKALGIDHIATWTNLCEALPPTYTQHVAKCFFEHMERKGPSGIAILH